MKTLTIRDSVYKELKSLKRGRESFSELFDRLAKKEKRSITEFAGFLSDAEAKKAMNRIAAYRKDTETLDKARVKRLKKQWSS